MSEIWKTAIVDGVENPRYQVSNMGRVKCLNWNRTGKERLCSFSDNSQGYLQVAIDCVPKMVHRIVAETFIPNPEGKPYVDHVDTNRKNNCVWNLRWVTPHENNMNPITLEKYKKNNAKWMKGKFLSEHPNAKAIVQLTLDGIFVKKWSCSIEIGQYFGKDSVNFTRCCKGKRDSSCGYRWMYYYDWLKMRRNKSIEDIKPLFV